MVRKDGELVECSWPEALDAAAEGLRQVLDLHGPQSVAALGGARGTNEDAYVWARFVKGVLGTDNVDAQLGDGLPADVVLGLPDATIADLDRARAIVVVAPDLKEELPVLSLRVRRAADDLKVPLIGARVATTASRSTRPRCCATVPASRPPPSSSSCARSRARLLSMMPLAAARRRSGTRG